jgi:hypothetical protein
VDSAKFRNEAHFMSLTAMTLFQEIGQRAGINICISQVLWLPALKCLSNGEMVLDMMLRFWCRNCGG